MALRLSDYGRQHQWLDADVDTPTLARTVAQMARSLPLGSESDAICWLLAEHDDGTQAQFVNSLTGNLPQWSHHHWHYLPLGAAAVPAALSRLPNGERWLLLAVDLISTTESKVKVELCWQLWQRSDHGLLFQALVVGIAGQRLDLAIADLFGRLREQVTGTLQAAILPAHACELWAGAFVALNGQVDSATDYRVPDLPHVSPMAGAALDNLRLLYQQLSLGWWCGQALMLTIGERRHAGAIVARWGSH